MRLAATLGAVLAAWAFGQDSRPVRASPAGKILPLSRGELFLPEGLEAREGRVDLLVHFHGAPRVVREGAVEAGWKGAVLAFSLKGLSGVYQEAFRDREAFPRSVDEARDALRAEVRGAEWGRIVLSSFSAGYAAIREILRDPAWADRVDAVVLADSLHASYETSGRPEARQMEPFRAFAGRAARGEKILWSTHSAIVPEGYASTTETSEDLISAAAARRVAVRETNDLGMVLTSRADRGGFHVLGFEGADGPSHMLHLRFLGELFAKVAESVPAR